MSFASALLNDAHPLRSDEDIPLENLMAARTPAALAWGQLQGCLAHAPPSVSTLFAYGLVRASLHDALQKSGFTDAKMRLATWFCGLEPLPAGDPQVVARPSQVADDLLLEFSLSGWEPLAEAAVRVRSAARYEQAHTPGELRMSRTALAQAKRIAGRANILIGKKWPLAVLDHIHSAASEATDFAPADRAKVPLKGPAGITVIELTAPRPPLWALDVFTGSAIAAHIAGTVPLPCPGAYRAEALRPELWPNERGVLVADAARAATMALILRLEKAYALERTLTAALGGLRCTSRAPSAALLLAGFGSLRPIQIQHAFNLSKNGVRGIVSTLVAANLARVQLYRGQSLVSLSAPM